jgi:hypothetical protein
MDIISPISCKYKQFIPFEEFKKGLEQYFVLKMKLIDQHPDSVVPPKHISRLYKYCNICYSYEEQQQIIRLIHKYKKCVRVLIL